MSSRSKQQQQRCPVKIGDILKNQYKIKKLLGQGGFGAVFEVTELKTNERLAMKVELSRPAVEEPGLELEIGVLKRLQQCPHACRYYDEGKLGPFHYLIMQLAGRNLADIRRSCPNHRFSVSTCVRVCSQCLDAIEAVHNIGLLHRDIKPANFAVGRTERDKRIVYILDFGMVRRYRSKDGIIRPARVAVGFRGTVRYASINTHRNLDLGRRDDMWSWLYMLIEMYKGELPWRLENDKSKVGRIKSEMTRQKLMENMDGEFLQIYDHVISLLYESPPDYKWCQNLLSTVLHKRKLNTNAPFDWEHGGIYAKHSADVTGQPFAKQMKEMKNVVQEKLENEEEDSL